MEQKPTIGRIVHYKLTANDLKEGHFNGASEGEVLPAIIVRIFENEYEGKPGLNLQVFVDGTKTTLWRTSIREGNTPGTWSWPPRV